MYFILKVNRHTVVSAMMSSKSCEPCALDIAFVYAWLTVAGRHPEMSKLTKAFLFEGNTAHNKHIQIPALIIFRSYASVLRYGTRF